MFHLKLPPESCWELLATVAYLLAPIKELGSYLGQLKLLASSEIETGEVNRSLMCWSVLCA